MSEGIVVVRVPCMVRIALVIWGHLRSTLFVPVQKGVEVENKNMQTHQYCVYSETCNERPLRRDTDLQRDTTAVVINLALHFYTFERPHSEKIL